MKLSYSNCDKLTFLEVSNLPCFKKGSLKVSNYGKKKVSLVYEQDADYFSSILSGQLCIIALRLMKMKRHQMFITLPNALGQVKEPIPYAWCTLKEWSK